MDFELSPAAKAIQERVRDFVKTKIAPADGEWRREIDAGIFPSKVVERLKADAKREGLWNLFLPGLKDGEPGTKLTNLEYAPIAEILGKIPWASEVMNCSAPDTGNMEILHAFGTPEQKKRWLEPLLQGAIRSCFSMTEPAVASSDPTNLQTTIAKDGDGWVVNGRKWFISGAADPRCRISIVLGVTDPAAEPHTRQSMLLVPMDTPGVKVVRNIPVMNHLQPEGHCEVLYENVRVPQENLLGEPGSGFALAQARLGPGRIHHCMRSIGQCEVALEAMAARSASRIAFGKRLVELGTVAEWIALSRIEIEQARLLVLKAAWLIDAGGNKAARREVAMIKVIVPRIQTAIANRAIQTFGAAGLTNDTPLAWIWTWGRALQIVDGPDEVHLRSIARQELKELAKRNG
jgi:acyl-CoA dehydrogenase